MRTSRAAKGWIWKPQLTTGNPSSGIDARSASSLDSEGGGGGARKGWVTRFTLQLSTSKESYCHILVRLDGCNESSVYLGSDSIWELVATNEATSISTRLVDGRGLASTTFIRYQLVLPKIRRLSDSYVLYLSNILTFVANKWAHWDILCLFGGGHIAVKEATISISNSWILKTPVMGSIYGLLTLS